MPGAKRNRKLTPNLKLEKRIKTSVHTLTGDAAGNEQLAFVHLAGKSKRIHSEDEAQSGQLENVRLITQDKAHATGRVVTRPRVADQASHEDWLIVESYLKMIDYSPVFSEWFQDATDIQVK